MMIDHLDPLPRAAKINVSCVQCLDDNIDRPGCDACRGTGAACSPDDPCEACPACDAVEAAVQS